LFFWLFGVCVLSLCSLLAVFFERAKTASVVGALLFFLLYFPYVFVGQADTGTVTKIFASLCPPVALSLGAAMLAELESAGDGAQWGNLGAEINHFTMGHALVMMLIDTGLFSLLAWYLDKVLVVGFGTRQPWNFLCLRKYWNPDVRGLTDEEFHDLEGQFDDTANGNARYENISSDLALRRRVLLRGIKKFFKTQEGQLLAAVQGLSVNLYEGQIFCLLGHNGAGKSTTINMLSGMLPVDEGDAIVYGMSVRKDMTSIRKILGVCPQHDVIWSQMTVREHLEFFAAIKGVDPSQMIVEVSSTIADVSLQEKTDALAGTLSGGQKRRLSAGIALIGGSRVVFLDEPSSGVDPCSRRELWQCFKTKKEGRTLIMTTHFMDEAEELGDRIAIMAAGQIKCVGTSLFLKAQYGVGYTLTITKRSEDAHSNAAKISELLSLISRTCPSAQLLSNAGVELVYRMPLEESRSFPGLFERFECSSADLGIDFFSVSVTTLEEVFLRVGQDEVEADQFAEERVQDRSFSRQLSSGGTATSAPRISGQSKEGNGGGSATIRSSIDVDGVGADPSTSGTATAIAVAAGTPPSSTAVRPHEVASSLRVPLTGDNREEAFGAEPLGGSSAFLRHVHALVIKRYQNAKRDRKAWCCQIGVPLVFLFVALASLKFTGVGTYDLQRMSIEDLPGPQSIAFAAPAGPGGTGAQQFMEGLVSSGVDVMEAANASSTGAFDQYLLDTYYRSDGRERYGALRFQHVPNLTSDAEQTVDGWQITNYRQPGLARPLTLPASKLWPRSLTVPVGTLWNETCELPMGPAGSVHVPLHQLNNRLQVDLFWNSSVRDVVPTFHHELHNQLLKASLGQEVLQESSVKIYNQPFPLTAAQKDLTDTQTSLFLALGFAFIPASYGAFVVLERENNSKHLQIVSGVNFMSYWLATWIWDVINYFVPAVMSIAMIAAFGIESLVSSQNILWTVLAVMLYGFSCTSFTYMLTFVFKSHTSAQNLLLVMYLFTGGILEIVALVLNIIPSTQDVMRNVLVYIFRIMPNYCLADALTNLITRSNPLVISQYNCPLEGCQAHQLNILGWDLIYMGVGSVLWFATTLMLELALATPRLRALLQLRHLDVVDANDHVTDPDVDAERERVRGGDADGEMVVLRGIRKVFPGRSGVPPKAAVKDMYFGIPEGQCFGYLGMNGAGKSTTMKILTGEELSTSGEATLGGYDINTQQSKVRQLIGYCPQFDALIGTLTAREHLALFARIKGVPAGQVDNYVTSMLDQLTLMPYADRQASTFSGGTKRKLSLGIALIGNPRIVFLDEPTTGVDPESRRFLWTLISATMQGRSVILTTHSMDECEALCSRIGIMVNGRLVCLGSAAQLKARHGSGYQIDVGFSAGIDLQTAFQKLASFMTRCFPAGTRIVEGASGSSRLKLRVPKGSLGMSAIFRAVEQQRGALELAEYSVSETTLDQIFINFARHQEDEQTGAPLAAGIGAHGAAIAGEAGALEPKLTPPGGDIAAASVSAVDAAAAGDPLGSAAHVEGVAIDSGSKDSSSTG